jgi:ABC-type lipoprotein export system ATPase subunit
MKITHLEIADYQQFKDFAIDLTYPAGHPTKAGEPLDKVCLIGQSGTGKTTILNILKEVLDFRIDRLSKRYELPNYAYDSYLKQLKILQNKYRDKLSPLFEVSFKAHKSHQHTNKIVKNAKPILYTVEGETSLFIGNKEGKPVEYSLIELEGHLDGLHISMNMVRNLLYVYLNAELIERANTIFNQNFINPQSYLNKDNPKKQEDTHKFYFDFSKDNPQDIWKLILEKAQDYIIEYVKRSKYLAQLLINDPKNIHLHLKEIEDWQKDIYNPFGDLAQKLDIMLDKFNLKMKQNIDFENPEDVQYVLLQPKENYKEKFNYPILSTGTKQILMTATPLFALDTKDTVVLFDEPERSLYPDIQRVIIKHYTDLAPEAQFFFATHSPLIASQFEPWEIVELKFNEEGKVYRELYYEGENHVDNYTIFPQYLRWDSILTKVFDLEMEGNEKRTIKLNDLTNLEIKLRNAPQEQKRAIWEQYEKLANLLDWHIDK